jgi:hypothetical protein
MAVTVDNERLPCKMMGSACRALPAGTVVGGFYHVTALTGSMVHQIVEEQLSMLSAACLLRRPNRHLHIGLLADSEASSDAMSRLVKQHSQSATIDASQQPSRYEAWTLQRLHSFCTATPPDRRNRTLVYYLHSKGVSGQRGGRSGLARVLLPLLPPGAPLARWLRRDEIRNIADWRHFMEYISHGPHAGSHSAHASVPHSMHHAHIAALCALYTYTHLASVPHCFFRSRLSMRPAHSTALCAPYPASGTSSFATPKPALIKCCAMAG